MKKVFFSVVVLLIVFSMILTPVAYAAIESNKYINSYSAAITTLGNGKIKVNFSTFGTDYMDDIGASQIELYQEGYLVKVFYAVNPLYSAGMMGHNTWYFYGSVTYNGTAGKEYYAIISHYAGDSTGHGAEGYQTAPVTAT